MTAITLTKGQEVELTDGRHFIIQELLEGDQVKMRHLSDTYSITTSVRHIMPPKLDTKAMNEAPEMRALESFGLNPQTITESLQRIHRAMHRDGLTNPADITPEVLAAYMEADRKAQERIFMEYMTNPRARKALQDSILDVLEGGKA